MCKNNGVTSDWFQVQKRVRSRERTIRMSPDTIRYGQSVNSLGCRACYCSWLTDSAVSCFPSSLPPQWATLSQACTTLPPPSPLPAVQLPLLSGWHWLMHTDRWWRCLLTAFHHLVYSEVSVYRYARYFTPRSDPIPILKYRPQFDTNPIIVLPLLLTHPTYTTPRNLAVTLMLTLHYSLTPNP